MMRYSKKLNLMNLLILPKQPAKIHTTLVGFADDLDTFIERIGAAQAMGVMRKVIMCIEEMRLQHLKLITVAL